MMNELVISPLVPAVCMRRLVDRGIGVRETERRAVKEYHRLSMANTMSSWGGSLPP